MLTIATMKYVLIVVQGARRTALTRSRRKQTRPLAENEEH